MVTALLFLPRELVPGHPSLMWYQPDGTRVVSVGHTLVSLVPCFWPEGRRGGCHPYRTWGDTAYLHQQASLLVSSLAFKVALLFLCCRRTAATRERCRATRAPGSPSAPAQGSGIAGASCGGGDSEGA